jgi:type VI secretion system secreted protein VgrG
MAYTQDGRLIALDTPLGKDVLLLQEVTGHEGISQLFRFDLHLLSENAGLAAEALVGQRVTVTIRLQDDSPRYLNGVVGRFTQGETDARFTHYGMQIVPWLWLLTRTADCRIFQHLSVPEILEKIFNEHGLTDYTLQLQGSFPPREYCVQYRETDFNFVSRLMEQVGIFYFFAHEATKHTLVLANAPNAHGPCPHQETARCELTGEMHQEDVVSAWRVESELRPAKYALADFNFETPGTRLLATVDGTAQSGIGRRYEIYDYPGEYGTKAEGEQRVKLRVQEEEATHCVVRGSGNCRAFTSGYCFSLEDHPRNDANTEWVLVEVEHAATAGSAYRTGMEEDQSYSNRFTCIAHSVPFRPPRRTPKPVIFGAQTAIVVGPKGEEIHTDKYGRVRVQFHWDREGEYDEKSSCWVRVSQDWAGKRWGAIFLPRIGQEVIVKFLEGDPDQPIITGRVYNAEQMPPYTLAGEQTKSSTKTYSSKGGGGFNEIRFEDKKGEEQLFLHAERQYDNRVKKDSLEWVGQDRHLIVERDQLEAVKGDKHLRVHGDQNEQVDGTASLKVGMDLDEKVGMKAAVDAGMEIHLKAGMTGVIEGGMTVTLKAGGAFLVVGPTGVAISGMPILLNSGGAAGAGSGASPEAPKSPREADKAEPGEAAPPLLAEQAPAFTGPSPQAAALRRAAQQGVPFCEKCAEAARQAALARGATPEEAEAAAQQAGLAGAEAASAEAAGAPESAGAPSRPGQGGPGTDLLGMPQPEAVPAPAGPSTQEQKTFVGIQLVDKQGNPVPGARYRIVLPDGKRVEGVLDSEGKARVDGIDPGTCQVSFPDIDGREWGPA